MIDIEKDVPKMLKEIYIQSYNYEDDSRSPIKLKERLDRINNITMTLWLAVVKKQTWGAVNGTDIENYE